MKKIGMLRGVISLFTAFSVSTAMAQTDSASIALQNKLDSLQTTVTTLQLKEDNRSKTEYDNAVWKRNKYMAIGLSTQKFKDAEDAANMEYKSKVGVLFEMGKTFYLHKKPIANLMKVGIDWSYLNFSFAKYEDGKGINMPSIPSYDDDDYDADIDPDIDIDLGVYSLAAGMSVGPSVTFAPFYNTGKGLQHILAQTYLHVTPSYTGILLSKDNDTEIKSGYTTYFNWGLNVSYKKISIGYEYRWGKSKFNSLSLDMYEDDENGSTDYEDNAKQKIKFGTSSFYIRLRW